MPYFHKQQAVILLLWCCQFVKGQQYNFDFYNKSNGLANNEVQCIMQASNGFMCFGTPSGASIFDGAAFTNYDRQKGFLDNRISGMSELNHGQIALFTGNNGFYRINNRRLSVDSSSKDISIKNIYHGKSGVWYASTFSGLYIFDDGRLLKLPVSGGKFPGINCVVEWQDSLLIIGRSYESIDIYNRHTWKLIASSKEKLFVRDFCADPEGNIWISSIGSGVLLLKPGSIQGNLIQFEKIPSSFTPFLESEFRAVVFDKENNYWMATINNGLLKYNPSTHEFFNITIDQGLISNTILSLCCDNEDNIWIGTNRGLQKLVHKNVFFYSAKQGLPADLVLDALPLPGKRIVTCGYSGVGYITKFDSKIKAWRPPLEDEYFSQFISFRNGYFGLSKKKLVELNISLSDITAKKIYSLSQHSLNMIGLDEDKLLLSGDSAIFLFKNGAISELTKDSARLVSCMAMDASGDLWTGSLVNTIHSYHLAERNNFLSAMPALYFSTNSGKADDFIQCITTKKNRVIYGTSQSGLTILSNENNKINPVISLDISNGLSANNVLSLLWYNDTTLLVGTGYGLDKIIFSPVSTGFHIRSINDFYNFSNSVYSVRKDDAGNVLLGTASGLLEIPSVDIEYKIRKNLPIVITSVYLPSTPDSMLDFKKVIELAYNNNGINIFFASPSFTNEKSIRYTYRLEGGNQNSWSHPSSSNAVALLNLQPGRYHFVVKTVNILDEVSDAEASVDIIVRSAFWQRWWFILAVIITIASIIYLVVKRRIQNVRHESVLKNKITEAEMVALRAQMNPHFIFNCMNIIDGLMTSNRKEEAQDFLQKFSKLIRLVLENSQYQQVPLQQDLQALELYVELEAIRSNNNFKYEFDVDEELIEDNYKIPPLLVQPYIENAIIHGLRNKENREGQLLIKIKKQDNFIVILIEDNGIGRLRAMQLAEKNKKPHQPLGMKVTAKRIDLLQMVNQDKVSIKVTDLKSGGETGTKVAIRLPLDLKFQ